MINNIRTSRERIKKTSITTSEGLSAAVNSSTDVITSDRRISLVTEGLPLYVENWLRIKTSNENSLTISEYVLSLRREVNPSQNYTRMQIQALVELSEYSKQKPFEQLTREDVLSFLYKFRKTEDKDPLHKWIGTYNLKREILRQFFTWLNDPNIERNQRSRPKIMENISKFKRKEVSIYRPTDLWTGDDDLLFLRYCPSKRNRCYHMLSGDSSCRPHELLKLRTKDIVFKTSGDYQYAEITVNGKTGTRTIPLFSCIPYLKDWLDEHPQRGNPNAMLFPSMSDKNFGRKMMGSEGIRLVYRKYKLTYFPKLLENPNVAAEDKIKIKELLKKPWNPYIRRHSALTEKARILREPILKMHAGWSGRSQMNLKYEHWFGNESSQSLLEAYGILPQDNQSKDVLKPKQCPNCNEPNKPDGKFCAKCRMVLTYDAYNETVESQKEKEDKLNVMEERFNLMQSQMESLIAALGNMDQLTKNTFAKQLFSSGIYERDMNP
jgi:integrase/recombinase XerD